MSVQAAAAAAELDVLIAFAKAAIAGAEHGPMCRPVVTDVHPNGRSGEPFFRAVALRHATHIRLSQAGSFVPNDVDLGVEDAPFMLLTGPNTGGKSTLMRQVRHRGSVCTFHVHHVCCLWWRLLAKGPLSTVVGGRSTSVAVRPVPHREAGPTNVEYGICRPPGNAGPGGFVCWSTAVCRHECLDTDVNAAYPVALVEQLTRAVLIDGRGHRCVWRRCLRRLGRGCRQPR
jgi:hypothetical protein